MLRREGREELSEPSTACVHPASPARDSRSAVDAAAIARVTEQFSGADVDALVERAKEYVLTEYLETHREREILQEDLVRAAAELVPTTQDWLRTARNLVKYAGGDDSYRDLEGYLKANKLL